MVDKSRDILIKAMNKNNLANSTLQFAVFEAVKDPNCKKFSFGQL